jgi:hypothetical protein
VYRGPLNDLLRELAQHPKWREVYGPPSIRGKDQELILRFLALYYNAKNYQRPLKGFLNRFMDDNRKASSVRIVEMRQLFERTATVAADSLTRSAFRPERNLNAAVVDAFLVGLARRLNRRAVTNPAGLRPAADSVLSNEQFLDAVTSGTTDVTAISRRLELATSAFAEVQ